MEEKNGSNFIIDTSVLIKWLGEEAENLEEAMRVKNDFISGDIAISVPALVFWELNNFLGRRFDPIKASVIFNQFKNYKFHPHLLSLELSLLTFKIMERCPRITFYDASYHALALHLGGTFLTADKKYYNMAKSFGSIKLLRHY